MAYYLGIDLGTTYTAAAVWRDGRVEIANLGTRAPVIPSVVLLRDDGTFLTGEAAARRALTEPQRIAREFKRRFGDPTPIMIGGTPYSADALTARLLRWVVDAVSEREGRPPDGIVVSHPANWGPFKQDLLRQVFRLADLRDVTTISEPEAAVIHYASQERVPPGAVVAVYDLGGGTFDSAVLRRTETGWEILGEPEGVERLGGVDFDQAVFHHVSTAIGDAVEQLDPEDPTALAAVARLRQECVDAKEALASDVDVTIPVLLPSLQTEVRLNRQEFEGMIRPALADSIGALRRALSSAGVETGDVSAVLLVGGSSRLPLVAELVGSELRRPVAVDAHPKHGVALGAAIVAAERGAGRSLDTEVVPSIEILERPGEARLAGAGTAATEPVDAPAAAAAAVAAAAAIAPAAATAAVPPLAAALAADAATAPAPPTRSSTPPQQVVIPASLSRPPSQPPQPPVSPPGGSPGQGRGRGGPPSGRSGRPPWLAIAGGIVAVAIIAAAGIALGGRGGGDDDDDGGGTAGTDTSVTQDSSTTTSTTEASTTTTSEAAPAGPTVQLTGVEVVSTPQGDRYEVTYSWTGFEPLVSDDPASRHFHFFLNTTTPENAGTNGNPPGNWELTDDPGTHVLDAFGPGNKGGATQICGVVADSVHAVVDPASGNCLPLPS